MTDTGIGMSEEQVGRLFQPFTQVDSSATRKFGGTGLGLCISKRSGRGPRRQHRSAFRAGQGQHLQRHDRSGAAGRDSHDPRAARRPLLQPPADCGDRRPPDKIELHGRILLAEDGPDNQRLICLLLKKAGAEVTAVENGQLAVEAALAAREAGEPFDVILMDMQMPVMDGYEATRQLRQQGYTGPIIALTAHAMAEALKSVRNARFADKTTPYRRPDVDNLQGSLTEE